MERVVTAVATQAAAGKPWTASLSPDVPYVWRVTHLAVEIPGWASGLVYAIVRIDGAYLFGTQHGEQDTADGAPIPVRQGQNLTVTWIPGTYQLALSSTQIVIASAPGNTPGSGVPAPQVQGRVTAIVEQIPNTSPKAGTTVV